jgi:hypothetical protein
MNQLELSNQHLKYLHDRLDHVDDKININQQIRLEIKQLLLDITEIAFEPEQQKHTFYLQDLLRKIKIHSKNLEEFIKEKDQQPY